jgi:hypothetical protein
MKPNYYQIIKDCIESGCRRGVSRAFKHTEDPSYDDIETCVYDSIMIEITGKFTFEPIEEEIYHNDL